MEEFNPVINLFKNVSPIPKVLALLPAPCSLLPASCSLLPRLNFKSS
ncbi:MAG: hypothetical protein F6K65_28540 [Moorea sp. SIO3C2]|nr:hypothetical protein [Moorena sp. SIO3C2]